MVVVLSESSLFELDECRCLRRQMKAVWTQSLSKNFIKTYLDAFRAILRWSF